MKKILFLISILISLFITYQIVYLYAYINPKLTLNNINSYYFYDNNEQLYQNQSKWINYEQLGENIINATIAIEDKNFWEHDGFDYPRIIKAAYNNIRSGSTNEGASTISQQYTKNLYLDFEKTYERKIKEAWLTVRLETHYSKEEILEGYLNTINYGGIFGINNASLYYFNKNPNELTIAEASLLAGIPKYPNLYSPYVNLEESKKRQEIVLISMKRDNYINDIQYEEAINQELIFNQNQTSYSSTLQYYKDQVIEELKTIIPNTTESLHIYTNLDQNAQTIIDQAYYNNQIDDLQTATVMIEPQTGKVIALAGGIDYTKSQYNRATSVTRSVGSTLKPFLYYTALENGFTSSTNFTSEKTTFVFNTDQTYSPTNFADSYPNKSISLATALAYSDNIYAVKTHLFLGENNLVNMMKRVGITTELNEIPSLALGSEPISIFELTAAYQVLANEGTKIQPYFITKITDDNGNILYEHKTNEETVLNTSTTYIINELLSNSTSQAFINYSFPTAFSISDQLTKKYAIKTGTTEYDHLMFGFNKDIVVGTWSGYDNNQDITSNATNANKQIWTEIIENYLKEKEDNWYQMPSNVVGVLSDPVTGQIATEETQNKTILYYIKGTEPTSNKNFDDLIPTIKEESNQ